MMSNFALPLSKSSFILVIIFYAFASNVVTSSPYVLTYEDAGDNEIIPTTRRPLLGANRCTRGPAYWCHNITQAKECGAVKHCIGKVWEPMKLPADNDDVCDICKEMVKEARDQLLSNETQDELRQVLEGSCKLIPLEIVSDECCKLADDFIPELVDALASRMDPQVVCAVSGLCNSVRIDEMLGQIKEIEGKTPSFNLAQDSCPKCTHYVGKAIDYFKKLTKTELLHQIFEVCGQLGSYSDSCRVEVTDEIDAIYSYLQNEINAAEVCGLVGLCQVVSIHPVKIEGSSSTVRVWAPPTQTDYQCDFCKQLVSYLKNWFTTDTTKEEFKEIITGLCKETGKYKDECLNLANEYGDLIYQLIVEELDPEKACIFMESCNATSTIRGRVTLFSSASNPAPLWTILHSDSIPMTKLQPADRLTGNDERPSHQPGFTYPMTKLRPAEVLTGDDERPSHQPGFTYPMIELTPAEKRTGNDGLISSVPKTGVKDILPTCGICTFTITKLIDLVGHNMTREAIDEAMEKVCDVVPHDYKDECLTFMKEYGDKVAEMILLEGSAHGVCIALHLCLWAPSPTPATDNIKLVGANWLPFDRYMPQVMVEDELTKPDVGNKPSCALCEFVMTRLDSMLKDNATEQEIKDTVMQICNYVPRTLKDECREFIDTYGDDVIDYLRQEMDPKEICTELKFCDAVGGTPVEDTKNVMDLNEMDKCELCTLISSYLSAFLDDPKVDTSIDKLVEHICPLLPKGHATECKELIEDYGPYLLSLLAQATDKGKVCASIDLCPEE